MLTPHLESLIYQGLANYNTAVIGGSGVGNIFVQKGSFIVITDFVFSHFADVDEANIGDPNEWLLRANHQIEFSSEKSRNHFVIRSDFNQLLTAPSVTWPGGSTTFNTYLLHTSNVHINITSVRPVSTWLVNYSPVPADTNEDLPPLGYQGLDAVRVNSMGQGAREYVSLGDQREVTIPLTAGYRDQFRIDPTLNTRLNNPFIADARGNGCYPIVNIGYVQVNKEVGKIAQGTR